MRKLHAIRHEFVQSFPNPMEHGILYISVQYKSMGHLCCCGCGKKVVTPLSPTGWRMTFDGQTVSVAPSVGSWNLDCKSHYWIAGNHVKWAGSFSDDTIAEVFARDQADKRRYYGEPIAPDQGAEGVAEPHGPKRRSIGAAIKALWLNLFG